MKILEFLVYLLASFVGLLYILGSGALGIYVLKLLEGEPGSWALFITSSDMAAGTMIYIFIIGLILSPLFLLLQAIPPDKIQRYQNKFGEAGYLVPGYILTILSTQFFGKYLAPLIFGNPFDILTLIFAFYPAKLLLKYFPSIKPEGVVPLFSSAYNHIIDSLNQNGLEIDSKSIVTRVWALIIQIVIAAGMLESFLQFINRLRKFFNKGNKTQKTG